MTIWWPAAGIKVKVLGLVWRGTSLLAAGIETDTGRVKGFRPLGGSIEFGETREIALAREIREELGCGIIILGPWVTFENIFRHEGATGHEFIFAAPIRLEDEGLYEQPEITFAESDGSRCTAQWIDPARMPRGIDLYPVGLSSSLSHS